MLTHNTKTTFTKIVLYCIAVQLVLILSCHYMGLEFQKFFIEAVRNCHLTDKVTGKTEGIKATDQIVESSFSTALVVDA